MKTIVVFCTMVATTLATKYTNGYISQRNQISSHTNHIQHGQFPFIAGSIEPTNTAVSDSTHDSVGEWRERKTHQFEATPNNPFARHPERQIIGVLNTDFVPSDDYTDFLLAYLPDITEILKEVKIANGGEMPALGNNPDHWLKMLLPLGRRYLQTRARIEGRDYLYPGEEKALNFVDRVTDPLMQFVKELL